MAATFPPSGPVTMTRVIPSYLYEQYDDDPDLQAFVQAFNGLGQSYIDTINGLNLPIYTAPNITGALLDWVAQGLYGMQRPYINSGSINFIGAINTYALNYPKLAINGDLDVNNIVSTLVSDDIFKRILTWHFYKGDGKVFNLQWLKRRIMRFLLGADGAAPNVADTSRISITFGAGRIIQVISSITVTVIPMGPLNSYSINTIGGAGRGLAINGDYVSTQTLSRITNTLTPGYQVTITIIEIVTTLQVGPLNTFVINSSGRGRGMPMNADLTTTVSFSNLDATTLINAINTGVLELPFQFTWTIREN